MSEISSLIKTLKQRLKASGVTYADIAIKLELSEASIKRLFAQGDFSLTRIEQVCQLAGLTLSELVEANQQARTKLDTLTLAQEREIAEDMNLLLIAISVISGFSYKDLLQKYCLSEHECIQKLAQLDRLQIIDLLPGNRIKLRISPNFRWNTNGPIQRFFLERVEKDFFNSRFDQEQEKLLVLNGLFTQSANAELQQSMDELAEQFYTLIRKHQTVPMDKRHGTTLVLALRQWRFSAFSELERAP